MQATISFINRLIVDSRHDLQVELRVSRSITAGVSSSASPASALPCGILVFCFVVKWKKEEEL